MKINGVQKECPSNFSVSAMLRREGYAREGVAVELNIDRKSTRLNSSHR